jgi:SAM-dependent methyltransferase
MASSERGAIGSSAILDGPAHHRAMAATQPRRFCCDEDLAHLSYDGLHAADDLEAWQRDHLHGASRELIEVVAAKGVAGATLLDVGAGVGAVHLTLLERGAARAVDVDASREYLAVAGAEAERRGLADRVEHRYGDVVELADALPPADVVTLDSVICCYPYLPALLDAVLTSRPRVVGITYPRDVWWMRAYMIGYNRINALRRRPGRYYIHRHTDLQRLMADAGYGPVHDGGTRTWRVVVYEPFESSG